MNRPRHCGRGLHKSQNELLLNKFSIGYQLDLLAEESSASRTNTKISALELAGNFKTNHFLLAPVMFNRAVKNHIEFHRLGNALHRQITSNFVFVAIDFL